MQKKVAGEKETTPGSVDLNQMIPLFLAASEERRAEAFAVLRGDRKDEDEQHDVEEVGKLVTQGEIANMLHVHPTTVRRWKLPGQWLGRWPRYQVDEVMASLKSESFKAHLRQLKQVRKDRKRAATEAA